MKNTKAKSKYNQDWEDFTNESRIAEIEDLGCTRFTAKNLKEETGAEPRIRLKMDKSECRPDVHKKLGLFIQPETNSHYVMTKIDHYTHLEPMREDIMPKAIYLPEKHAHLRNPKTENAAIMAAVQSGAIHDVCGQVVDISVINTGCTETFQNTIDGHCFQYKSVPIQVDATLVSDDTIFFTEAKTGLNHKSVSFRQVGLPHRNQEHLESLKEPDKRRNVRSLYLEYEDKRIRFIEINFEKDGKGVAAYDREFIFEIQPGERENLQDTPVSLERWKGTPLFQANNFPLLHGLIEKVKNIKGKIDVEELFKGTPLRSKRQHMYYIGVLVGLGVLEKKGNHYYVTELGRELGNMAKTQRALKMFSIVASHPLYNALLCGKSFSVEDVMEWEGISRTTALRRISCAKSWMKVWKQING